MTLIVQNSRTLLKRSQISGATPTVKTGSTQHTDGTWVDTEIYPGEIYWNMQDRKMYIGWEDISGNTGTDSIITGGGTGSCITDLFVSNIYGCSPINVWDNTIFNLSNITMAGGQINSFGTTLDLFSDTNIVLNSSDSTTTQVIDLGTTLLPSRDIRIRNIDISSNYSETRYTPKSLNIIVDDGTAGVVSQIFMEPSVGGVQIKNYDVSTFTNNIDIYDIGISLQTNILTGGTAYILIEDTNQIGQPLIQLTSTDGVTNTSNLTITETTITIDSNILQIPTIQAFADDAAAGVGGLVLGDIYETDGTGAAPLNVAGILMRKQ